jgi:Transmembrane protein 43
MSEGDYSETTNVNFFQRMGQSLMGVLAGIVMFLVSFVVLFWNEGRAVTKARALQEAGGAVVSVASDKVDAANEGKLVHVTGEATTDETLTDDRFGVSAKAIKLERKVEMYQFKEDAKKEKHNKAVGGGYEEKTTYSYKPDWFNHPIDSTQFHDPKYKDKNPPMPFAGRAITAEVVKLGAFKLSSDLVAQITNTELLPVTGEGQPKTSETDSPKEEKWKNVDGVLYDGDPSAPKIGDMKVSFAVVKPQKVSIMAAQSANTFKPYETKTADDKINMLKVGDVSAKDMIKQAEAENTSLTWILRLVGFVLMGVGIYLVLAPMATFANIVPFLGGFVSGMVGFMLAVFSCVAAGAMSLITIAIAWLFYRPLLGIGLLVLAGGGIVLLVMMLRRAKPAVKPG